MTAIAQAKCVACSQTAPLRPDGRFKRHPKHPTARERCASSGSYPVCPCCGRDGTEPTVSPNTRLCRDCARAVMSGKLPMKCDAKSGRDLRYQRDVYAPSVVARVYAHLPPKALRAHLTAREVAAVVAIAEQRCPGDEARAVALLLDVLPRFKGATLGGFDAVRLHRDHWTRLLGRRGNGYARLRSALELFDRGASHLRGERATTWHLRGGAFTFDPEQPERALVATTGRTFGRIYAAARAVAREA